MQFSYLDGQENLDSIMGTILNSLTHRLADPTPDDTAPEIELPDDWKTFNETLTSYQRKYNLTVKEARETEMELVRKRSELKALKDAEKVLQDSPLKTKLTDMIAEFERVEEVDNFEHLLESLRGTCKSMKKVLENTNPEHLSKFQCFVCMDRSVDTFLDPCGHVLCTTCWRRNTSRVCPGCRASVHPKKIYLLS
jgi:hypothetical protein